MIVQKGNIDSKEVRGWHKRPRNKRVVFHFIPTYSSWLNLAVVLFNMPQAKVLSRGVFPSRQVTGSIYINLSL